MNLIGKMHRTGAPGVRLRSLRRQTDPADFSTQIPGVVWVAGRYERRVNGSCILQALAKLYACARSQILRISSLLSGTKDRIYLTPCTR